MNDSGTNINESKAIGVWRRYVLGKLLVWFCLGIFIMFSGLIYLNIKYVTVFPDNFFIHPATEFRKFAIVLLISYMISWIVRILKSNREVVTANISFSRPIVHEFQMNSIEQQQNHKNMVDNLQQEINDLAKKLDETEWFASLLPPADRDKIQKEKHVLEEKLEFETKESARRAEELAERIKSFESNYSKSIRSAFWNYVFDSILFFLNFGVSGYAALCMSYAILEARCV